MNNNVKQALLSYLLLFRSFHSLLQHYILNVQIYVLNKLCDKRKICRFVFSGSVFLYFHKDNVRSNLKIKEIMMM